MKRCKKKLLVLNSIRSQDHQVLHYLFYNQITNQKKNISSKFYYLQVIDLRALKEELLNAPVSVVAQHPFTSRRVNYELTGSMLFVFAHLVDCRVISVESIWCSVLVFKVVKHYLLT